MKKSLTTKNKDLVFVTKYFNDLTPEELYAVLHLRSTVFMFEQDIILLDIDNNDQKALHILGKIDDNIVGYTRIFKPNDCYDQASFGRVVVSKLQRGKGYGHAMMYFVINTIKEQFGTDVIKISAQSYLEKFYQEHGFKTISEEHLEDKMPHVYMLRE